MNYTSKTSFTRYYVFCLLTAVVLFGGVTGILFSCESEDVAGNGEIYLTKGDPITVNFTVDGFSFDNNEITLHNASPNPSVGAGSARPSGIGEGETVVTPIAENLFMLTTLKEEDAPVKLRNTPVDTDSKVRVIAYSGGGYTTMEGFADYEVTSYGALMPLGATLTLPSSISYRFVAYSFHNSATLDAFADTTAQISAKDVLWGDTTVTITPASTVHIKLKHLFSKITMEATLGAGVGLMIEDITGASVSTYDPKLVVENSRLIESSTPTMSTIPVTWPSSGSATTWISDPQFVFTDGENSFIEISSVNIDGTTYSGLPRIDYTSEALEAGKAYTLLVRFVASYLTATPSTLNFPYIAGSNPRSVSVDTNSPTGWMVSNAPSWVTAIPSGNTLTVSVPTANTGSSPRSGYITLSTGGLTSETIYVEQDYIPGAGTPFPETVVAYPYVGAFWRWNETGERVIRMPIVSASAVGPVNWSATVWWMDDRWHPASGDGIVLAAGAGASGSSYPLPGSGESYPVGGGLTTVSGTANTGTPILFRIGLQQQFAAPTYSNNPDYVASFPARYAVILLTYSYGGATYESKLYLRQGEGDDFVMRNGDNGRTQARRFSPFNLTTGGSMNAQVPVNSGIFTAYPTQSGAYFQWAKSTATTQRFAWDNTTTTSLAPLGWNQTIPGGFWDTNEAANETCPPGYRRPNDGSTSGYSNGDNSEYRHSLGLDYTSDRNIYFISGYYADGFFDRGLIEPSRTNAGDNRPMFQTAVSAATNNNAYVGVLVFNPSDAGDHYNASLFFPVIGQRNSQDGQGLINNQGMYANYLSSSLTSAGPLTFALGRRDNGGPGQAMLEGVNHNYYGHPVRCVRIP